MVCFKNVYIRPPAQKGSLQKLPFSFCNKKKTPGKRMSALMFIWNPPC